MDNNQKQAFSTELRNLIYLSNASKRDVAAVLTEIWPGIDLQFAGDLPEPILYIYAWEALQKFQNAQLGMSRTATPKEFLIDEQGPEAVALAERFDKLADYPYKEMPIIEGMVAYLEDGALLKELGVL